jgi:hypothetical protein
MVTVAGTEAWAASLDCNVTLIPGEGAAALMMTLPIAPAPPIRVAGLTETVFTWIGRISRFPEHQVSRKVAVKAAPSPCDTTFVATLNVALEAPAGIEMVVGNVTFGSEHAKVTTTPADAAGESNLIKPVTAGPTPPITEVGENVSEIKPAGLMTIGRLQLPKGYVAEMNAWTRLLT